MSGQPGVGIAKRHILGSFKDLDNGLFTVKFDYLSQLSFLAADVHFHDLIVGGILDAVQYHQRAVNGTESQIFNCHDISPSLSVPFHDTVIEPVNSIPVFIEELGAVIGNVVFDRYNFLKNIVLF